MRKLAAALFVAVLSAPVFAAPDLAPINDAKADMLAYAGAILGLGIAVWGAIKVVGMFRR